MKKNIFKKSIYIAVFSCILISVISAGAYRNLYVLYNNNEKTAYTDTINFSYIIKDNVERTLAEADQLIAFIKYQYEEGGAALSVDRYAEYSALYNPDYSGVGIIDASGIYTGSEPQNFEKNNVLKSEYFLVHAKSDMKKLFISKTVQKDARGKYKMYLTRRINKRDGGFDGVVIVSIDEDVFRRKYDRADVGEDGVVLLMGSEYSVYSYRYDGGELYGQDMANTVLQNYANERYENSFKASGIVDSVERYYSFSRSRTYPVWSSPRFDRTACPT